MLVEQPHGGVCELHGEYDNNVKLITIPHDKLPTLAPLGSTEESIFANPIVACKRCRTVLAALSGGVVFPLSPFEDIMPDDLLDKENPLYSLLERFFNIKDLFPDHVGDIYLVPQEELVGTRFVNKPLNVVVSLKGFNIQSYTSWTVKSNKSAAHLWNIQPDRSKFWTAKVMRLLLALGKLHLSSIQFNVWIASYTRIVSVEYFCTMPPRMVQLQPSKLYKVK